MLQSRAYQSARLEPRGTQRTRTFRELRRRFGLTEFEMNRWSTRKLSRSWIAEHLTAQMRRALAGRALRATLQFHYAKQGRPRFKGVNQIGSIAGQDPTSGLRLRNSQIHWQGLVLALDDRGDTVRLRHAFNSDLRVVRVVRRRVRKRLRHFVQLVCTGKPYRAPGHGVGTQRVGIDPGLRYLAVATATNGSLINIEPACKGSRISQLGRAVSRKRAAENLVEPTGASRRKSRRLQQLQARLADEHRRARETRRNLHGRIANAIVGLGPNLYIEKNSFSAFQRRYKRTIQSAAPAAMIQQLIRKAANAGGEVVLLSPTLRMSQLCHGCGAVVPKDLDLRTHSCVCGVGPVQRDIYSAWLAIMTRSDPGGSVRWFDADQAHSAWSGAEQRLPAASKPLSIEAFEDWVETQVASGDVFVTSPNQGTERLASEVHVKRGEARDVVGVMPRVRESRAELRHTQEGPAIYAEVSQ
jgi:putative transposase